LKLEKNYLGGGGEDITFAWIQAHRGIVLNETRDAPTKESIREGKNVQYMHPVTDLNYWKTKLGIAAKEWYIESGNQKGGNYFRITKWQASLVPEIQTRKNIHCSHQQNEKRSSVSRRMSDSIQ
jgi:hypothetical protein